MEFFDVVMLSRIQFAVTVFFHFIFVPLTLGMTVLIAIMETIYVRTGNEQYKRMAKFWGKLFLINFAVGVVTGITLEFQFGTNWSRYSEFMGDIFGSILAIEALAAFFLESTFIAVWHFGWDKVGKKFHCVCIWLVAIASNLSAVWIIIANGWMQHPIGYEIRNGRAELADFLTVITNPYAWGQYFHTVSGAWMLSGFFVLGVSAWHLIRKSNTDFFNRSVRIAAPFTLIFALAVALLGHSHGNYMASVQPEKLAAMESHWETQTQAPIYLLTWPDAKNEMNLIQAIPVPGMLSFMAHSDFNAEVKGLKAFPKEERPPVLLSFLSFRLMVGLGTLFVIVALAAVIKRKDLGASRCLSRLLALMIPLPYICIMAGWMLAEVGRQPWIVYRIMKTTDAVSPIPASSVSISLIAFILIYTFLGVIAIYLLRKFALKGPETPEPQALAGGN